MNLNRTFDELLNDILADYQGQDPPVDTAKATMVFIKSAAIASALWGLANQLKDTAKNPFYDQCNLDDLRHHAQIKGVLNIDSYIDSDGNFTALVAEVGSRYQNPGGIGNKYDWPRWANGQTFDHDSYIETCVNAFPFENKRYPGSVDIVIVSDRTEAQGGEQDPSDELCASIASLFESKRNLGIASDLIVWQPTKLSQAFTLTVSDNIVAATDEVCALIKSDIVDYMKSIAPGSTWYRSQVEALAISRGVNVESITPNANVAVISGPDEFQRIWPDVDNSSVTRIS
jgi:uncharacterized phage protein gp47/JayE